MSEKKEIMLGGVSWDELAEAQKKIGDALVFIAENIDTEDKEIRGAIMAGFSLIALDDMMKKPLCNMIAKQFDAQIKAERKASKSRPMATFSTVAKS